MISLELYWCMFENMTHRFQTSTCPQCKPRTVELWMNKNEPAHFYVVSIIQNKNWSMKLGWKHLAALKCQQQQGLYICWLSFSQCVLCVIYLLWVHVAKHRGDKGYRKPNFASHNVWDVLIHTQPAHWKYRLKWSWRSQKPRARLSF